MQILEGIARGENAILENYAFTKADAKKSAKALNNLNEPAL